jgi:hypothetical protein
MMKIDPKSEEAAELAKEKRVIVNIAPKNTDGTDRTAQQIFRIARDIEDEYGALVYEVLNRADDPTVVIEALRLISENNLRGLLGSTKTVQELQAAFDAGALGYVSHTNRDALVQQSIHADGGAKVSFPTTSSSESFGNTMGLRMEAMGASKVSELPVAQQGVKIFPHTRAHPMQPDETDPTNVNFYTQRLLAPSAIADGKVNTHFVFTGYSAREHAQAVLGMKHVNGKPFTTMIGPAVSSPEELEVWLKEIEHAS